MVGLEIYYTEDIEIYNFLHKNLSGIAFFRKSNDKFYIKSPNNKLIKELLSKNLIIKENL